MGKRKAFNPEGSLVYMWSQFVLDCYESDTFSSIQNNVNFLNLLQRSTPETPKIWRPACEINHIN